MNHRILFAGSPQIAVPLLRVLAQKFEVVAVLTATDKPQGRSNIPVACPVKETAIELGIPVLQFDSLKTEARQAVVSTGANTLVTFAFGKIFGPKFLSLFGGGTFNVHPSALPQFRGPSPIQMTILNCLRTSSISLQEIGLGMDEGRIYAQYHYSLDGTETNSTLNEKVALIASECVPATLADVFDNKIIPVAQEGCPSYCAMIEKDMGKLDFNLPALEVHSKIRGLYPWPKTQAQCGDKTVFFTGVWGGFEEMDEEPLLENSVPGTVVAFRKDRGIGIACKDKVIWISALQLPGKKEMDFKSFANGNAWIKNAVFN